MLFRKKVAFIILSLGLLSDPSIGGKPEGFSEKNSKGWSKLSSEQDPENSSRLINSPIISRPLHTTQNGLWKKVRGFVFHPASIITLLLTSTHAGSFIVGSSYGSSHALASCHTSSNFSHLSTQLSACDAQNFLCRQNLTQAQNLINDFEKKYLNTSESKEFLSFQKSTTQIDRPDLEQQTFSSFFPDFSEEKEEEEYYYDNND